MIALTCVVRVGMSTPMNPATMPKRRRAAKRIPTHRGHPRRSVQARIGRSVSAMSSATKRSSKRRDSSMASHPSRSATASFNSVTQEIVISVFKGGDDWSGIG